MGALPLAEKQLIKAAGLDADTFLPGTSYVTANGNESNTVLHKPPLAGGSALIITLPATYENSAGWCVQFWISRAQNRVFMRKREGWTIGYSVWEMFATATPPIEHDLPLAGGYAAQSPCKYSKAQDGRVYVGVDAKTSGTIASAATIATLPAGYRPAYHIIATVTCLGSTMAVGTLDVFPDGRVAVYHKSSDITWVSGQISFLAS